MFAFVPIKLTIQFNFK